MPVRGCAAPSHNTNRASFDVARFLIGFPGAESPWLFSAAPLGPARIVWLGVFASRTRGWKPPEEKDDDVAAFARTRVNPEVATNPHSGECGYTDPAESPWLLTIAPTGAKKRRNI